MTRRPMLILNGRVRRYKTLDVRLCAIGYWHGRFMPQATIDYKMYDNVKVSCSTRPSGRRVIWVSTDEGR